MKVDNRHGVALPIGPHRDLSPVAPSVEEQAWLQRREADEVLVAPGHQFVLFRHVEQVVSIDADNVSLFPSANIKAYCFGVPINSPVDGECGLVSVSVLMWRRQDGQQRECESVSQM